MAELLHGLGLRAACDAALHARIDFEGDQWTFFKPPLVDPPRALRHGRPGARRLAPLPLHIAEQLEQGRPVLVELDSYYCPTPRAPLPPRAPEVGCGGQRDRHDRGYFGYFHNQGYYEAQGEDFRELFQEDGPGTSACCRPTWST
jgi:hypothetical protein